MLTQFIKSMGIPLEIRNFMVDYVDKNGESFHKPLQTVIPIGTTPETDVEILTMKTTGDKILDRTLDKIGGKGLFVKELDRALLEGRSQLSVHSLKDMPMEISEELPILFQT